MVVSDVRENGLVIGQREVDGLIWVFVAHLFSGFVIAVDNLGSRIVTREYSPRGKTASIA